MNFIKSTSQIFTLLILFSCTQKIENNKQSTKSYDQIQEKAAIGEKFEISAPENITYEDNIKTDTVDISFIKLLNNAVEKKGLTTSSFLSDVATHAIIESDSFVRITFDEDDKKEIESKLGSAQLTLWKVAYLNFHKAFSHAKGRLYYGRSYHYPTLSNRAKGIKNFAKPDDDLRFVPSSDLAEFSKELPAGILVP